MIGTSPPKRSSTASAMPNDAPRLVLVEAGRADELGDLSRVGGGEIGGRRIAAEQLRGHHVDTDVGGLGGQDRRHEQLPRTAMVELAHRVGVLDRQPSSDLAGPALRRSRLCHPVTRSFATVALMGSEPAGGPPATTRRLDAASALNVQRLLDDAARADGFVGLSDQLAADLDDLVAGGADARAVAVQLGDGHDGLAGIGIASRRDGDWTMQTVTDPQPPRRKRRAPAGRGTARLPSPTTVAGGSTGGCTRRARADDAIAADVGLRADRELLQMRRPLPTERRPEVDDSAVPPGHDEEAWLTVNNRAFAGHHEQHGWTLDDAAPAHAPAVVRRRRRAPPRARRSPGGVLLDEASRRRRSARSTSSASIRTSRDSDSGSQLTLAGLDHLAGRGITEALLYVAAENTAATAMYERLGFTVHRVDRAYVGEVHDSGSLAWRRERCDRRSPGDARRTAALERHRPVRVARLPRVPRRRGTGPRRCRAGPRRPSIATRSAPSEPRQADRAGRPRRRRGDRRAQRPRRARSSELRQLRVRHRQHRQPRRAGPVAVRRGAHASRRASRRSSPGSPTG